MSKSGIFVITSEMQQVLDSVPEHTDPRSKLDPFKPYILKWRRQGKTYRKIQQILRDECHMPVAYETLRQFAKSRSRPRKPQPDIDLEPPVVQPVKTPLPATRAAGTPTNSDGSTDPYAEARERMRKHKEATAVRKPEPLFPVYTDEELLKPHVLKPKTKKEN